MEQEIKLQKETQSLLKKVVRKFDKIRAGFVTKKEEYGSESDSLIGHIWWDNHELVWIFATDKEEGYEGSQSQVGVDCDGKLRWEYQSHCSCNSYEDTNGLPAQFTQDTLKSFDFTYTEPPLDWEVKMQENMKKLLSV